MYINGPITNLAPSSKRLATKKRGLISCREAYKVIIMRRIRPKIAINIFCGNSRFLEITIITKITMLMAKPATKIKSASSFIEGQLYKVRLLTLSRLESHINK